ncbi:aromatic compound dioxygenase [Schizopora paradoxa]|uniref:Aromatic compound dioxygenase n=1 Tax=Schizopora paradoxa TaxID=27342 RepID=A0A0H2RB21_9AGAM|nr:aromatic compound dioxygenase [Schizopora paradoxa]
MHRRKKRSLSSQTILTSNDLIKNHTCVTAPEIEEGPFYVNDELVRTDMREDQAGVDLNLDVVIIDSSTCKPVPDALVELWSANATGIYGAFEHSAVGRNPPMSSSNTWLRGGFPTDDGGSVELRTVYPGFYPGRTVHVHVMVHTGWRAFDNGTFDSHSGRLTHIGQFFFEEEWNDRVIETTHYHNNKSRRTYNLEDHDFNRASIAGSSAIVHLDLAGDAVEDGLLGFITVAVDLSANHRIHSISHLNSSDFGDDVY